MRCISTKKGNYIYNYMDELGSGAFGTVYKGYIEDTKEIIALKFIDIEKLKYKGDAFVKQVGQEANILQKMSENHEIPHVVQLFDCCISLEFGKVIMVIEFCGEGTLGDMIEKKKKKKEKFSEDEAIDILYQITEGLKHIHTLRIAHRDIKPENIFIKNGMYKLGDFGQASDASHLHDLQGTALYWAPEVAEGNAYTVRCDMWSLGILFYEMLFAEVPNPEEVKKNNYKIDFSGKKVSKKALAVLKGLLQVNPDDRICSAELIENPLFKGWKTVKLKNLHAKQHHKEKGHHKQQQLGKVYEQPEVVSEQDKVDKSEADIVDQSEDDIVNDSEDDYVMDSNSNVPQDQFYKEQMVDQEQNSNLIQSNIYQSEEQAKDVSFKNQDFQFDYQKSLKSITTPNGTYVYNYTDELGSGAFGTVYKGYNEKTKEVVAIKLIEIDKIQRNYGDYAMKAVKQVGEEANILQNLTSNNQTPFIVKLYDCMYSKEDGYVAMIMEFCGGGTLDNVIKKKVTEERATGILYQLAQGLQHIHSRNVAHRDIKPANVFIKNGIFKLGDFSQSTESKLIQTAQGTQAFFAPEIDKGWPYTVQCDMWSLGVMYYQLLFSELPYDYRYNKYQVNLWDKRVSTNTLDVLKKLFQLNPDNRITSTELVNHPVFNQFRNKQQHKNQLDQLSDDNIVIYPNIEPPPNETKQIPEVQNQNNTQYSSNQQRSSNYQIPLRSVLNKVPPLPLSSSRQQVYTNRLPIQQPGSYTSRVSNQVPLSQLISYTNQLRLSQRQNYVNIQAKLDLERKITNEVVRGSQDLGYIGITKQSKTSPFLKKSFGFAQPNTMIKRKGQQIYNHQQQTSLRLSRQGPYPQLYQHQRKTSITSQYSINRSVQDFMMMNQSRQLNKINSQSRLLTQNSIGNPSPQHKRIISNKQLPLQRSRRIPSPQHRRIISNKQLPLQSSRRNQSPKQRKIITNQKLTLQNARRNLSPKQRRIILNSEIPLQSSRRNLPPQQRRIITNQRPPLQSSRMNQSPKQRRIISNQRPPLQSSRRNQTPQQRTIITNQKVPLQNSRRNPAPQRRRMISNAQQKSLQSLIINQSRQLRKSRSGLQLNPVYQVQQKQIPLSSPKTGRSQILNRSSSYLQLQYQPLNQMKQQVNQRIIYNQKTSQQPKQFNPNPMNTQSRLIFNPRNQVFH